MENRIKKALSLVITFTMTISLFAIYPTIKTDAKNNYKTYKWANNSVMVELENTIVAGEFVTVERAKDASARNHVKLAGYDSSVVPPKDSAPALAFNFVAESDGEHKIWLRYQAFTSSDNSIFWSIGAENAEYEEMQMPQTCTSPTEYLWISKIFTAKKGETITVRYKPREENTILDKVIIANDMLYRPNGLGEAPDGEIHVEKFPEDRYPIPTLTPPPEHPRVLFRASDIPNIKANVESKEMANLKAEFDRMRNSEVTGYLPDGRCNSATLVHIQAKAFDYVIYGNEENGKQAIEAMKNYFRTVTVGGMGYVSRDAGHMIYTAAEVYDWCYPLMSERDKQEFLLQSQFFSVDMEVGMPPDNQSIVLGHGAEWQMFREWLSMGIACYDEFPDIYNMVAGKILDGAAEWKNWWYKSGLTYQGTSYGPARVEPEMWGQWLLYRMSGVKLFSDDIGSTAYEMIYKRRPDGRPLDDGNTRSPELEKKYSDFTVYMADFPFTLGNFYKDGIVKKEFYKLGGYVPYYEREGFTPIDMFILEDRSIETKDVKTLPLTRYFGEPVGDMVARTGWNMGMKSPDVLVQMKINAWNGQDHKHHDSGHFQIYYKGNLASETSYYETDQSPFHDKYLCQTYSHNTLLIGSSSNPGGSQNFNVKGKGYGTTYWDDYTVEIYRANPDNELAEILGAEFGPDLQYPEYSYISGDIAQAYDIAENNAWGVKATHDVKEAVRSMIFLPTGDEKNPGVFVVFDRVQTAEGGHKKAFLLQMLEEPTVEGNVTTITRTEGEYSGKLVNQTLLPEKFKIEKIGGPEKRFWAEGENWFLIEEYEARGETDKVPGHMRGLKHDHTKIASELGWGRVEISPQKTTTDDCFLNVMYVGDATDTSPVKKATLIEAGNFVGTKIFDRVVMFNKNKQRTTEDVTFMVSGGEKEIKINVAGLEAGTWAISRDGEQIDTQISSQEGGIIYFTGPSGKYSLKYISTDANKQFTQSPAPDVEGITIYVSKNGITNYLYTDVDPTIRDGRTLVPMRALLEAMDAQVEWDPKTATAIADNGAIKIQITENSKTAYVNDEPVELDVPAMIINGRFLIPIRFIAENLGSSVSWNELAQRVEVSIRKVTPGYAPIADAIQSGSFDAAHSIMASVDDNFETYWSVNGIGEWGIYDLGKPYNLEHVVFSFSLGTERVHTFDIEVSLDGVNYTKVIEGAKSSGQNINALKEVFDLGGVKARYVKYVGLGNSQTNYNTIQEIKFKIKK